MSNFKEIYKDGERAVLQERHKGELGALGMSQNMMHVEFVYCAHITAMYRDFIDEGRKYLLENKPQLTSASEECQFAQYLFWRGIIKRVEPEQDLNLTDVIRSAKCGES